MPMDEQAKIRDQDKQFRAEMRRSVANPTPKEIAERQAAAAELDSLSPPSK